MLGVNSITGMSLGDGCFLEMGTKVHESLPIFISTSEIEKIDGK
jgi:tetrahydrodipicolinate N-succinyltransferase